MSNALTQEQIIAIATQAAIAAVTAAINPSAPAKESAPKVQPKADGKVYRSAKGKEQAKVACEKAWADAKAKAGVKRVRDLSPKQQEAVRAQCKAIWAAVPKTRTTKA